MAEGRKNKKALILINEALESMVIGKNGSLAIALALAQKGYKIFFADEVEIGFENQKISAQQVKFSQKIYEISQKYGENLQENAEIIANQLKKGEKSGKTPEFRQIRLSQEEKSAKISSKKLISYSEFSFIVNRLDPIENVNWMRDQIEKLRIISIRNQIPVIGMPINIDKYEPLAFAADLLPETAFISANLTTENIDLAKKMLKNHQEIVIKPAKSGQGKGVKKAANIAEFKKAVQEINDEFGNNLPSGLILQEMFPGAVRGDIRTIFYRDKKGNFKLGGHVGRAQLQNDFVNCVSSGRAAIVNPEAMLLENEIADLEKNTSIVLKYLNKHKSSIDTAIIGVDFMPKFLSKAEAKKSRKNKIFILEINFLCVALFNMIDYLNGKSPFAKGSLTDKIVEGF